VGRVVRSPSSWLFWLIVIALGAAVAHIVGEKRAHDITPPPASGAPIAGRARIIDGDTIEISGERIRLYGIDAPESRQQCRTGSGRDYPCGRAATRALTAAIRGSKVNCTPVDHDRYDRDVAICSAGGHDLGDIMVRSGNAIDYRRHSQGRYAAAEREARAAKRGMWAGTFDEPEVWRRAHPW
jgi:endonuclease YncB( thermonuclease family)